VTRLVICGVPRSGKTTLAARMHPQAAGRIRHTDDLISFGWSRASEIVAAQWFTLSGPWVVEGVAAVRALRKWLRAHPEGAPCDRVIWCNAPHVALTPGQETMAKGARTVWNEIAAELEGRGVVVERR
jgi:hypothetical protein